jgi:RHS repeat-associated protein
MTSRLGNGTRASYSYDDADQVLRLANIKADATTISSFAYKYDSAGNRTRVAEANGDRVTWTYDNLYQLTREQRSGANAYTITHSYDAVGNRLKKVDGGAVTTFTYDAAKQLLTQRDSTGRTTFTSDANGNQSVQKAPTGRTTFTWDQENRLSKAVLPTGTINTFQYDTEGLRIRRDDSTGTRKGVWDLQNLLLETDQSDVTQVIYTQEPAFYGNLLSQFRGTATNYYHFQGLGSTDRLTDGTAAVTDSYLYEAYGAIRGSTGATVNPLRYVGRWGYYFDGDLSQYYVRARYYQPSFARFLTKDPAGVDIGAFTDYFYVKNMPANAIDPSGLWEFRCRPIDVLLAHDLAHNAVHCWLVCDGKTYSLLNRSGTASLVQDAPEDWSGRGEATSKGEGCCDCIARNFKGAQARWKNGYRYDKDQCNSNWFAWELLNCCAHRPKKPTQAGWKNWPWGMYDCGKFSFECTLTAEQEKEIERRARESCEEIFKMAQKGQLCGADLRYALDRCMKMQQKKRWPEC